MKKVVYSIVFFVFIALLVSCGGSGKLPEISSKPAKRALKKANTEMDFIERKIDESTGAYADEMNKLKGMIKRGLYQDRELRKFKLKQVGSFDEIQNLDGFENPAFSHDRAFGIAVQESGEHTPNGYISQYSIRLIDVNSGNQANVFTTDESLLGNDVQITSKFSLYAWHPYINAVVLTCNEGRENNVYLAYVMFNTESNEVQYCLIQVSDFTEQSALMNYNWLSTGTGFTFTRFVDSKYETYEFDLKSRTLHRIAYTSEVVSFVYDKYKQKKGFAVIRNGNAFYPYFVERIDDFEIKTAYPILDTPFSTPFIFGSFAQFKELVGFYVIDTRDNSMAASYNYETRDLKRVDTKWELTKSSYYLSQCLSPVWVYDKFLLFAYGKKVAYVSINEESLDDQDIVIENLASNEGSYLNSFQNYQDIMSFAYSYRFNNSFKTVTFRANVNEVEVKMEMDYVIYAVEIKKLTPIDEMTGTLTVKRDRHASDVHQDNAVLGMIDGQPVLSFNTVEDLEKAGNGEKLYVRWSEDISPRQVNARYRIAVGENVGTKDTKIRK